MPHTHNLLEVDNNENNPLLKRAEEDNGANSTSVSFYPSSSANSVIGVPGEEEEDQADANLSKKYLIFFILIGQILKSMYRDASNTFKPYKYRGEGIDEWLQPVWGTGNVLYGVGAIAVSPLIILGGFAGSLFFSKNLSTFMQFNALVLFNIVPGYLYCLTTIARGVTQIAFTPLMLLKKSLRNIISFFSPEQTVENQGYVTDLMKEGEKSLNEPEINIVKIKHIATKLHHAYQQEISELVPSNINIEEEDMHYIGTKRDQQKEPVDGEPYRKYFNLFKTAAAQAKQKPVAPTDDAEANIEEAVHRQHTI